MNLSGVNMKRSEIVEQVASKFAEYIEENVQSTPRKMVDFILKEFEEKGMKPPSIRERVVTYGDPVDSPTSSFNYTQTVNKWEPEDGE